MDDRYSPSYSRISSGCKFIGGDAVGVGEEVIGEGVGVCERFGGEVEVGVGEGKGCGEGGGFSSIICQ